MRKLYMNQTERKLISRSLPHLIECLPEFFISNAHYDGWTTGKGGSVVQGQLKYNCISECTCLEKTNSQGSLSSILSIDLCSLQAKLATGRV